MTISQEFGLTDGRVTLPAFSDEPPCFLHPSATRSRLKVREAEYFLALLKAGIRNEAACLFHADAFLAALRSTTLMLQKECSDAAGFVEWYQSMQAEMRADPTLRTSVDLRNEALKEGLVLDRFQVSSETRFHRDGRVTTRVVDPVLRFVGRPQAKVMAEFEHALSVVTRIVEEAHELGFVNVPPRGDERLVVMGFFRENADGSWRPVPPPQGVPIIPDGIPRDD